MTNLSGDVEEGFTNENNHLSWEREKKEPVEGPVDLKHLASIAHFRTADNVEKPCFNFGDEV